MNAAVRLSDLLEAAAEDEARGSRDFGRGFMHAVTILRSLEEQAAEAGGAGG